MVWTIETRLSSSAVFSDIVLPAAWYYEKWDLTLGQAHNPRIALIEPANPPVGESRPEWEIYAELTRKIGERAKLRGLHGFTDRMGKKKTYAELWDAFTMKGRLVTQEDAFKELFKVAATMGIFPRSGLLIKQAAAISSLHDVVERFMKSGAIDIRSLGLPIMTAVNGSDCNAETRCYPFHSHVQEKETFPTYTRRAQFYIDHEWYLELGEGLF